MAQGTAKLVLDLGNSETRIKVFFGKTLKGNPRSRLVTSSNRYAEVPSNLLNRFLTEGTYTEEDSRIFEINGVDYCLGRVCDEELYHVSERPSALEKKYKNFASKVAITNAFCTGFNVVAEMSNTTVESLDIDWEVIAMLPPADVVAGGQQLVGIVQGINHIKFLMPELEKDVVIKSVKVLPEGLCAFLGCVMKSKTVLREGYADIVQNREETLICDIGAGTTDFLKVKGAQPIASSMFTTEIGGNNVHRIVQKDLKDNYGIDLPDSVVREGCEKGYVMNGSHRVDICKQIERAKRMVSRKLVDAVQGFFESSMIPIATISNILVCGGGAEAPTDNDDVKPIANYIVEYIKNISANIKLIEIPKEKNSDGEEVTLSPRLLNIRGAGYMAE